MFILCTVKMYKVISRYLALFWTMIVKEELFSSSLITLENVLVPRGCWMLLLLMSLSSSIMNIRPSNSHILGKCSVPLPSLKLYCIFKMLDLNWCTLVLNLSFSWPCFFSAGITGMCHHIQPHPTSFVPVFPFISLFVCLFVCLELEVELSRRTLP